MPSAPATAAPSPPATCEVRDWVVFGPGVHKGALYTPEMCGRVPANFDRLRADLTPLAKIGHDRQQRLAKSLGFLNVGRIAEVKPVGGGAFALTVVGIPTAVGAEINAGRLNSGSVELLPKIADPDDPAKDIDGPVLTGVAFLGEEQPAVKGYKAPRAVFADGTPVPASADPAPWLNAMAEVATMAARSAPDHAPRFSWHGREYAAQTICFSEMNMDKKAQLAALGLTPEQIDQILAICGDAAPAPATASEAAPPPATPATPASPMPMSADAPPWAKEMSAKFAAFSEEMTKRVGAVEKMSEDAQKKDEEVKGAAFSAHCEAHIAKLATKVEPGFIEKVIRPAAKDIAAAKTFASETDRVKAFADLIGRYESLPDDPRLKAAPAPRPGETPPPVRRAFSPLQAAMLRPGGVLDRESPRTAKELRASAV